jgi:hypothetical protein
LGYYAGCLLPLCEQLIGIDHSLGFSTNAMSVVAKDELFAKAMGKCYQMSPLTPTPITIYSKKTYYT